MDLLSAIRPKAVLFLGKCGGLKKKNEIMQNFREKSERLHIVTQLLKAYTLFEKDIQYVVMENKVKIVDENTGRIMDGRRYSDGLHQAIEAKEIEAKEIIWMEAQEVHDAKERELNAA